MRAFGLSLSLGRNGGGGFWAQGVEGFGFSAHPGSLQRGVVVVGFMMGFV